MRQKYLQVLVALPVVSDDESHSLVQNSVVVVSLVRGLWIAHATSPSKPIRPRALSASIVLLSESCVGGVAGGVSAGVGAGSAGSAGGASFGEPVDCLRCSSQPVWHRLLVQIVA
jgi:hypothetical protein